MQSRLIARIKVIFNEFLDEWKKGKYYLEKEKQLNIENWKKKPKEMALHKKSKEKA